MAPARSGVSRKSHERPRRGLSGFGDHGLASGSQPFGFPSRARSFDPPLPRPTVARERSNAPPNHSFPTRRPSYRTLSTVRTPPREGPARTRAQTRGTLILSPGDKFRKPRLRVRFCSVVSRDGTRDCSRTCPSGTGRLLPQSARKTFPTRRQLWRFASKFGTLCESFAAMKPLWRSRLTHLRMDVELLGRAKPGGENATVPPASAALCLCSGVGASVEIHGGEGSKVA